MITNQFWFELVQEYSTCGSRPYPALNIIGGRRYMKKSSSSNLRMWELLPLLTNKITIPVQHPWFGKVKRKLNRITKIREKNRNIKTHICNIIRTKKIVVEIAWSNMLRGLTNILCSKQPKMTIWVSDTSRAEADRAERGPWTPMTFSKWSLTHLSSRLFFKFDPLKFCFVMTSWSTGWSVRPCDGSNQW